MDDDPPKLDAALDKIAILAGVPDQIPDPPFISANGIRSNRTKRDSFRIFMRCSLAEARSLHLREPAIISAFPTLSAVDGYLEDIALAAGNLADLLGPADWTPLAARNLDDPLEPADWARSHARDQLQRQLIASRNLEILSELAGQNPLGTIAEILGELAKAISMTRRSLQKTHDDPATSVGYQTTNSKKHLGAKWVIRSLIIASKMSNDKMDATLTFSRGPYDVEGPLIKAINILKEADNFFSLGFFPEKLRKICEDVRSELNRK
jgi:hypothetical protein